MSYRRNLNNFSDDDSDNRYKPSTNSRYTSSVTSARSSFARDTDRYNDRFNDDKKVSKAPSYRSSRFSDSDDDKPLPSLSSSHSRYGAGSARRSAVRNSDSDDDRPLASTSSYNRYGAGSSRRSAVRNSDSDDSDRDSKYRRGGISGRPGTSTSGRLTGDVDSYESANVILYVFFINYKKSIF
jgi:hypothetical protein